MSTDNIINTQIQYRLVEEIQSLNKSIQEQNRGLESSDWEKEKDRLKEKIKKKSLELKIRNSDLKIERQGKYEMEKNLISLGRCFSKFSNNHEENIKKLLSYLKGSIGASSVGYLQGRRLASKKQEMIYEVCKSILDVSQEELVIIDNFKKSLAYQENTKLFSRNINSLILYKVPKNQSDYPFLVITFDQKINNNADYELILSLVSQFILVEEDRKNTNEDLISLYKEVAVLNRKISVLSNYSGEKHVQGDEVKKSLLKLLSSFSNSLISFVYARKGQNKFDRITQSCSQESAIELEENIMFKLQMLRITQGSKKRFYINFTKEDTQNEVLKKYKISSATSIPIMKNKKHLGNLVLLHQNNTIPSAGDLEYYDLVCLALTKSLG